MSNGLAVLFNYLYQLDWQKALQIPNEYLLTSLIGWFPNILRSLLVTSINYCRMKNANHFEARAMEYLHESFQYQIRIQWV